MKKEIPMPVIIATIAIVVVILGVVGYRSIVQPKPAVVPGGVHVSPPNFATPPATNINGMPSAPTTGGSGGQ